MPASCNRVSLTVQNYFPLITFTYSCAKSPEKQTDIEVHAVTETGENLDNQLVYIQGDELVMNVYQKVI